MRGMSATVRLAKARFEEAVAILRKVARDNPTSSAARYNVFISLFNLGVFTSNRPLVAEALEIARELERAGDLAPNDLQFYEKTAKAAESIP